MQPEPALSSGGIPMPGPGERVPMPAGPGTRRRTAGEKSASSSGLAAAAILTAGLAAAMVFRGDFRQAAQPAAAQPPAVQVIVKAPLPKAPAAAIPQVPVTPVQPPSELPSVGTPGSPVETAATAPAGLSSPLPFFSSDEEDSVPKVTALQPYGAEPAHPAVSARPVLPAADRLVPRLQPAPGGRSAALSGAGGARGLTVDASGVCTTCKNAVSGVKTSSPLQRGESYIQHEISTVYMGVCEGKYVYDYTNLTSNMTIGMKVLTSGGESWTFTLKPGEKTSLKSSTEFNPGTYETYRVSEVIN